MAGRPGESDRQFTPPVPDTETAIRLIKATEAVYGINVDTGPLEAFATEVCEYYEGLGQRIDAATEPAHPNYDQMYM